MRVDSQAALTITRPENAEGEDVSVLFPFIVCIYPPSNSGFQTKATGPGVHSFNFDRVFDKLAPQPVLYETCVRVGNIDSE